MTPVLLVLALVLAPLMPAAGQVPKPPQPPSANPTGSAVLDFKERIQAYLKVHNDAESKVPKLKETNDPAKVHDREAALGAMIRRMRTSAREGEVFGTSFREVLAREVRQDFLERSAADRKALMIEVPTRTRIAVNTTYPTQLPLATFPPRLLQRLPDLPPELEYRIVGRHIVLRDVTANVVVDVARDVVPAIPS